MSVIDKLLNANTEAVLAQEKEDFEVTRLSAMLGEPFLLTLQEIPAARYLEIQAAAVTVHKDGTNEIDLFKLQTAILADGIVSPQFNDNALLSKYGAATPKELFSKLFNAGEINKISDRVSKLSGFDNNENPVEHVKN